MPNHGSEHLSSRPSARSSRAYLRHGAQLGERKRGVGLSTSHTELLRAFPLVASAPDKDEVGGAEDEEEQPVDVHEQVDQPAQLRREGGRQARGGLEGELTLRRWRGGAQTLVIR